MEEKNSIWSVLIVVGVIIFFGHSMWQDHKERKASLYWPSTSGEIINVYISEVRHTSHDDSKNSFFGSSSYTDYEVKVTYDYSVDGIDYTGSRIEVHDSAFSWKRDAEQVVAKYKQGTSVKVFYNPLKPKKSVLSPG